jgi:pimeloyl-ACP methyl ester carboxylesterase
MPHAPLNGVDLYYEDSGRDLPPIVFCHEFAGDYRAWDPQERAFGRANRCVTYSHRGFPPSSVPDDPEAYSQDLLIDDLRALVVHLELPRAYFIGFSMGGSVVLNFALRYPSLCHGIVVVGTGSGTTNRERFERDIQQVVELIAARGIAGFAETYAEGPTRLPFKRKDPHGWAVFRRQLAEHSPVGQALTMQGVMRRRPTIFALEDALRDLEVPTLLVIGDEDEPCVDPAVFLKRHIPSAGLLVLPQSGHAVNLEEPALFNAAVLDFFRQAEAGLWTRRTAITTSLLPGAPARETSDGRYPRRHALTDACRRGDVHPAVDSPTAARPDPGRGPGADPRGRQQGAQRWQSAAGALPGAHRAWPYPRVRGALPRGVVGEASR